MTHLEVPDNNNLSSHEEEEPANENEEVPSPQIVYIQRKSGPDIIRSTDNARPRLSTVKGTRLIGPNDTRVLVHSRTVARDDVGTITDQGNPRELVLHQTRP